jgi:cell division protein FtsA
LPRHDLVAGLDIGTTKICCVTAEPADSGGIVVTGVGVSPSSGLKRGIVADLDATVHAIEDAVSRASRQSGRDIYSVYAGVTGEHIASLNSHGVIAVTNSDREIREEDVDRVEEAARVIVIPPDRKILHAIPRSYSVDGQNGIKHPVGMSGTRLEVETHIVTGAHTFLENVEKCVSRAGLGLEAMVLEPVAAAQALISPAEKDLGVALVDIGGGTTDIGVFFGGEIYYSAILPVGGNHVTNDIAQLLRVAVDEAERVKIEHGNAAAQGVGDDEKFPITQIGRAEPRHLRRRALCEIIEARMQELMQMIQKELKKSGVYEQLPAGVILAGGGSLLKGTPELASQVLGIPVRFGKPGRVTGLADAVSGPEYATAVGLALYGMHHMAGRRQAANSNAFGGLSRILTGLKSRLRTD